MYSLTFEIKIIIRYLCVFSYAHYFRLTFRCNDTQIVTLWNLQTYWNRTNQQLELSLSWTGFSWTCLLSSITVRHDSSFQTSWPQPPPHCLNIYWLTYHPANIFDVESLIFHNISCVSCEQLNWFVSNAFYKLLLISFRWDQRHWISIDQDVHATPQHRG